MQVQLFANNVLELFLDFLKDRSIPDTIIPFEKWEKMYEKLLAVAEKFYHRKKSEYAEIVIDVFETELIEHNVPISYEKKRRRF